MKLRAMSAVCAVAAMGSLVGAELSSSNTLGLMKVTSSYKDTIVAVPWVEVETGDAIKVANLVKTDNLTKGDKLFVYTDGVWYGYTLNDDLTAWTQDTTITQDSTYQSDDPAKKPVARGSALLLTRTGEKLAEKPFYLYGQNSDATLAAVTVAKGESGKGVYTLLAKPTPGEFDLNSNSAVSGTIGEGDKIVVPQDDGKSRTYYRTTVDEKSVWAYDTYTTVMRGSLSFNKKVVNTTGCTIPQGTGFWYVSEGGSPSFQW